MIFVNKLNNLHDGGSIMTSEVYRNISSANLQGNASNDPKHTKYNQGKVGKIGR